MSRKFLFSFRPCIFSIVLFNIALLLPILLFGESIVAWLFPNTGMSFHTHLAPGLVAMFFANTIHLMIMFFRVTERANVLFWFIVFNAVVRVALGIYFVVLKEMGAHGVLMAMACTSVIQAIALSLYHIPYLTPVIRRTMLKEALVYSVPLIPYVMGSTIFTYADRYIGSLYVSADQIGLYDLAAKVCLVILVSIRAFQAAVNPAFMKRAKDNKDDARDYFKPLLTQWAAAVSFLLLGAALFAEEAIVYLLPASYHAAYQFVPVLLFGYFFMGLHGLMMLSIIFEKRSGVISFITLISCGVNIVLNLLLIPKWGIISAAWATLFCSALTFYIGWICSNRIFRLEYEWARISNVFGIAAGVFILSRLLPVNTPWLVFALKALMTSLFALFIWFRHPEIRTFVLAPVQPTGVSEDNKELANLFTCSI